MAKEDLVVTLGLQSKGVDKQVKELNRELRFLEKEFKNASKSSKDFENSQEGLKSKLKYLEKSYDAVTLKLEAYKKKSDEVKKTLKEKQDILKKLVDSEKASEEEIRKATEAVNYWNDELRQSQRNIKLTEQDLSSFNDEIDNTKSSLKNLKFTELGESLQNVSSKLTTVGSSIKGFGSSLTLGVTTPILGAAGAMVKVAADAGEMQSKFDTVFKTTAKEVEEWAKTLGKSIGRSSLDLKEAVSNSADLMIGMGMTEEAAGGLSQKFIELAYDLGSFNNVNDATAIEAMTKAMMGETEMAKQLGLNLSVATMEQSEYVKGLGKKWKDMTMAEKAEAYYAEAIKQSTNALGDAARTSDSFTNQTRALQGRIKDLSAEMGEKLLPIALNLVEGINKLLDKFLSLSDETQVNILKFAGLAAVIGPILVVVGSLITSVGAIAGAFGALSTAVGVAGGWMAFFTASILPVVVGIAGLIASVVILYEAVRTNMNGIKLAWEEVMQSAQENFNIIDLSFGMLWETMQSIWDTVGKPLIGAVGEIIEAVVRFVAEIMPGISDAFYLVSSIIKTVWDTIGKPVFDFVMEYVGKLVDFVKTNLPIFADVFNGVMDSLRNLWNQIGKPVFDIIKQVVIGLLNTFRPTFDNIISIVSNCFKIIQTVWNSVLKPVFDGLINIVGKALQKVKPAFEGIQNSITTAMNYVLGPIQWVIDKISALVGWFSKGIEKAGAFLDKINPFKGRSMTIESKVETPDMPTQTYDLPNAYKEIALSGSYYQPYTKSSNNLLDIASKLKPSDNITSVQDSFNFQDGLIEAIKAGFNNISINLESIIKMDGREVAKATSKYTNNELYNISKYKSLGTGGRI